MSDETRREDRQRPRGGTRNGVATTSDPVAVPRDERITARCVADDAESLALVERSLSGDEFEVVAERSSGAPDPATVDCLVVADPNRPDLVESIRAEPAVPVVVVTETDDPSEAALETLEAVPEAGVVDRSVLGSDGDVGILARRVRHQVERRRAKTAAMRAGAALETARDGIAVVAPDGRFVQANGAFAARFGYDRDALVGTRWSDLFTEDEVDRLESTVLDTVDDTWRWTGECTGVRADGDPFAVRTVISRLEDGSLAVAVHDASD